MQPRATDSAPMMILGLACGHDSSVALVQNGQVVAHVLRERLTRQRHAFGLDAKTLATLFDAAGVGPETVDACALTGSHGQPIRIEKNAPIEILADGSDLFRLQSTTREDGHEWLSLFWRAPIPALTSWQEVPSLAALKTHLASQIPSMAEQRLALHVPLKVRLNGRTIPAVFVDHHAAHAASGFYPSPHKTSLVLTHDSGPGLESGFVFYGQGERLYPLAPHHLGLCALYNDTATKCGLEGPGGAGKLMGLASYGRALTGVSRLAGTMADWRAHLGQNKADAEIREALLSLLCNAIRSEGESLFGLGEAQRLPFPGASNLAASIQTLYGETLFRVCLAAAEALKAHGHEADALCLGGGGALNCPTNTRLALQGGFKHMFVPPHTENGGLSMGAAWWYVHNVLGQPRRQTPAVASRYAMMGPERSFDKTSLRLKSHPALSFETCPDPTERAAQDLAADRLIGWVQGRSETGPRALGHRSILADPRQAAQNARVNAVKRREAWRPFAPVCPLESLPDWFEQGPAASPFMLFTYKVRAEKKAQLAAVTHSDGTARAQSVVPEDGPIYELLKKFEQKTGVPVLLNTSFNGPGEPIVETADNALAFFEKGGLDVLYLGNVRVTKKGPPLQQS